MSEEMKTYYAGENTTKAIVKNLKNSFASIGTESDWNAKEGESGHVLNRTHWVEELFGDILPETTFDTSEGMVPVIEALLVPPTVGNVYTITYNGAVLEKECKSMILEGMDCIGFGNASAFGGENTGETFCFVLFPDNMVETAGAYGIFAVFDGTASVTMRIEGTSTIYHKLDKSFLPASENSNIVNGSSNYSIRFRSATEESDEYTMGIASMAEGAYTIASGDYSHAEGYGSNATGMLAHAEGSATTASGDYSHAEGSVTEATAQASHAEGDNTTASGRNSHAEGENTTASENAAHAEGRNTTASGIASHAEGCQTKATQYYSHAEGYFSESAGNSAHAEGYQTKATGPYSHSEGLFTTASGETSHAEGRNTEAASPHQHVQGKYNIVDQNGVYAHIVGNGEQNKPSNAHTIDWNGTAEFAGDVKANACGGSKPISLVELYSIVQNFETMELITIEDIDTICKSVGV